MQYVCVVLDFQFELGGIVIQISHLERERERDDKVNNISIIFYNKCMPHKYSICRKGIAHHLEHLPMGSISKPDVT